MIRSKNTESFQGQKIAKVQVLTQILSKPNTDCMNHVFKARLILKNEKEGKQTQAELISVLLHKMDAKQTQTITQQENLISCFFFF